MRTRHVVGTKLAGVVAVAACLLSLAGCGGSEDEEPEASGPPSGQGLTAEEATAAPPGDLEVVPPPGAGQNGDDVVPDENIVGGKNEDIADVPWTVALITPGANASGRIENFCGGALIGPRLVMTAAHCVDHWVRDAQGKFTDVGMIGPGMVNVVAGRTRLDDPGGQVVAVTEVWQSKNYVPDQYRWDFALLRLASDVTSEWIPLPPSSLARQLWQPGVAVLTTGWGCQYDNTAADEPCEESAGSPLKSSASTIRDAATCDGTVPGIRFDPATSLCLVPTSPDSTTCQGDSGGPNAVKGTNGEWYLVGLVSYGPERCPPGAPDSAALVPAVLNVVGGIRSDTEVGWTICTNPSGYCV